MRTSSRPQTGRLLAVGALAALCGFLMLAPSAIAQVLQAGNSIYRVYVDTDPSNVGDYTATTGPGNPAGNGLNVLYGNGFPGTSFTSIHSYTTNTDYTQGGNGGVDLSPYGVVTPIGTTGFRTTYTLPGPSTTPDQLTIVQDFNVSGTTFNDSHIDLTTTVTNTGSTPVSIGVRHELDYQIGRDDGPTLQAQNPNGPVLNFETDFINPTFEYVRIEDNDGNPNPPTFDVLGTVTGPSTITPTPTPPTRTVFAYWPNADSSTFAYTANPACQITGGSGGGCHDDSAQLYYWGDTASNAIVLAPGASRTVSMSMFATPPGVAIPADQPITSTGTNVNATEGQSFSGTVASFTDSDSNASAGEYSATINWGDGSSSAGTITGSGGNFTVSGSHTYSEEGSHSITVTINDTDNSANTATATSNVAIADAALHASGVAFRSGKSVRGPVATFKDSDANGTVSDYTASINWGDGASSAGTVAARSGGFSVSGSHRYSKAGKYTITTTIKDGGGSTATATSTVTVRKTSVKAASVAAKLSNVPTACVSSAFTATVQGKRIDSVKFTLDGRRMTTRMVRFGRQFSAVIAVSPGHHTLTVTVRFHRGSAASTRTFRRAVIGCPAPSFTG